MLDEHKNSPPIPSPIPDDDSQATAPKKSKWGKFLQVAGICIAVFLAFDFLLAMAGVQWPARLVFIGSPALGLLGKYLERWSKQLQAAEAAKKQETAEPQS